MFKRDDKDDEYDEDNIFINGPPVVGKESVHKTLYKVGYILNLKSVTKMEQTMMISM